MSQSSIADTIHTYKTVDVQHQVHCYMGLHGSCQSAIFGLRDSTRVAETPFTAFSGGGAYKCTPLDLHLGESKYTSRWQLRSRHLLYMVKTKDLCSAYCLTGRCTYHLPLCLSLSPARLLHSYVCPSIIFVLLLN